MKENLLTAVVLVSLCSAVAAQSEGGPLNAKQLAGWLKEGAAKQVQFRQFVDASYQSLVDMREICMPATRPNEANRAAAMQAVQLGINEGLFGEDIPAQDAVRDALGFWFPRPSR